MLGQPLLAPVFPVHEHVRPALIPIADGFLGILEFLQVPVATNTSVQDLVGAIPTNGLLTAVSRQVASAQSSLASSARMLNSVSVSARLMPSLVEQGHRYLLVVQDPGRPRGTGGAIGYAGFLASDGSHLNLTRFFAVNRTSVARVSAPAEFRQRWARFGALVDLRQANMAPDLPTSAGVIMQMAREHKWGRFDGIFAVDAVWMRDMLQATGPITVSDWPQTITSSGKSIAT